MDALDEGRPETDRAGQRDDRARPAAEAGVPDVRPVPGDGPPYPDDANLSVPDVGRVNTDSAVVSMDVGAPSLDGPPFLTDVSAPGADVPSDVTDASRPSPDASQGSIDASQVLPDASQVLPDAAQALPDAARPPLDASQPPPDAAQPPPDAAQPPPDAEELEADACVVETCDGRDQDCDGRVDEAEGGGPLSEPCYNGPLGTANVGLCHAGSTYCEQGIFGACVDQQRPAPERCDGADNDCNGRVDDQVPGVGAACFAGVGACRREGVNVCDPGRALEPVCSTGPGAPETERCDDQDRNCNGVLNDVPDFQVAERIPQGVLTILNAGCAFPIGSLAGPACNDAIHRYCAGQGCWASGFGPLYSDGMLTDLVCLQEGVAQVQTTLAVLRGINGGCIAQVSLGSVYCNAAIDSFCLGLGVGYSAGYGPIVNGGDNALTVVCLDAPLNVVRLAVPWADLQFFHQECSGRNIVNQSGGACLYAANQVCLDRGWAAGYGPVQAVADVATIFCIGP